MHTTNFWNQLNLYRGKVIFVLSVMWCLAAASGALAQQKRFGVNNPNYDERFLSYGFVLGVNTTAYQIKHADAFEAPQFDSLLSIQPQNANGFTLGLMLNMKLAEYLDFRIMPSVGFYEHSLEYNYSRSREVKIVESTMVEVPLLFKYKSQRRKNTRMYIVGGIKPALEAASQTDGGEESDEVLPINELDLSLDIGFGFDCYLPLFKFSPEIRFSRGILNRLGSDRNIFSEPLDRVNTNTVTVFLLFQ